jgi:hypothetical protein
MVAGIPEELRNEKGTYIQTPWKKGTKKKLLCEVRKQNERMKGVLLAKSEDRFK